MITFDFGKANRRWQKQWWRACDKARKVDNAAEEEVGDVLDILDEIDRLAAVVIESVAPEALIGGAPDDIDWTDPESLDIYLRADVDVPSLVTEAFLESSGNSQSG